jgi:amino acid transporter
MGGVSDKMKNAKRTFPLAMALGAVLITVIYGFFIFLWGVSANWSNVFTRSGVNLGNTTYVLMSNLGYQLGQQFSLGTAGAQNLSFLFARFGSFTMLLSYLGSFFVIVYMPIKSFILGTPKQLWPKALPKLNRNAMPANAMWLQAGVVSALIAMTSFGGKSAVDFYNVLTLMDNLSSTLPYLFLVTAFPFFKRNVALEKPFVIFKRRWVYLTIVTVVDGLLIIGVLSTIISAISANEYWDLLLELIGPLFFGLVGYYLFRLYEKRRQLFPTTSSDRQSL